MQHALIATITIAVKPADTVDTGTFRIPVFFFFGAAALYSAVAYTTVSYKSDRIDSSFLCSSCT